MASWLIVLIASIVFVGLFALGLSLTLIFKGHNIESEISTNPNMRKLGIRCVVEEARSESGAGTDGPSCGPSCGGSCSACDSAASAAPEKNDGAE